MRVCLPLFTILCAHLTSADLAIDLKPALTISQYQYGYNISISCLLNPLTPIYNLNVSIHNSTRSWLGVDWISSSKWNGYTAQLGNIYAPRRVIFFGSLVKPARRSASYSIIINATWTDESGAIFQYQTPRSSITLTHTSNSPPIITQIQPVATSENSPVSLQPSFTILDDDFYWESDEGLMTMTLSVLSPSSLSLNSLATISYGASILLSTRNCISFQCDFKCVLATFRGVRFTPAKNWVGLALVNLTVDDHFNGGIGEYHITQKLFNVTVAAQNQSPSLRSTASALTVPENGALSLRNITFYDIDAFASENVTLEFTAEYGRFMCSNTSVLSVSNSPHSLLVSGPYSVVSSSVLESMYYHPPTGFITELQGFDTITIEAIDGKLASCSASFPVDVIHFETTPMLISPDSMLSVYEDSNIDIPVSINDSHSRLGRQYFVALSVFNGSISLTDSKGLRFVQHQAGSIQFFASSTRANSAIGPIVYAPRTDFSGRDYIAICIQDDIGLWFNRTISIAILPVNDSPQIQISPGDPLTGAQGAFVQFNVSVVDVDDGNVTVSMLSANGTFLFQPSPGLNITGNTLSGSQQQVSAALSPVRFVPHPLAFGMDCSISVLASDIHNAKSQRAISVYLSRANTAPLLFVPKFIQDNANNTLISSISVSDYEDDNLFLALKVVNGSVSLTSQEGLTFFAGSGLNDNNIVLWGRSVSINKALHNLKFNADLFFSGNASLTLWLNDTVNSVGPYTVLIVVSQAKAPPSLTCLETLFADENRLLRFSSLQILDSVTVNPFVNFTASVSTGSFQLLSVPSQVILVGNATGLLTLYGPYVQMALAVSQLEYRGRKYFNSRCCGTAEIIFSIARGPASSSCRSDVIIAPIDNTPRISTCPSLPATLGVVKSLASCLNITDPDTGEIVYSRHKLLLQAVNGEFQYDFVEMAALGVRTDDSGSHSLAVSGVIDRLNAALNRGLITYNCSGSQASADVISIVVTDVDANVNVTSTLPVTLSPSSVQVAFPDGFFRSTMEDTLIPIYATFFASNSPESSILLTASSSVPGSKLDLLSAQNVSIALQSSPNNITMQISVSASVHNITLGYTPAPNWNSRFNPCDVILFRFGTEVHARIEVTVAPVNDAPLVSLSSTFAAVEDIPFYINASVADVDLNDAPEPYLFASIYVVPNSALFTLDSYLGLQTVSLSNYRLDFNGSLASVNKALQNLRLSFPLYHGQARLYLCLCDNGFSGSGGVKWSNMTSLITISHVNHPPSLMLENVSLPILMREDTTRFLNFTLTDGDDSANVTFAASLDGGLFLNVILFDGHSQVTGSFAQVRQALQNVSITPKLNWNGFGASLTVYVSDSVALVSKVYSIVVLPIEDPPALKLNCTAIASVREDLDIYLPALSLIEDIMDPDYEDSRDVDALYRVSLKVSNGTISLVDGDISYAYSVSDFLLHKSSLASLTLRYQPFVNFNGPDSFEVAVNHTTKAAASSCPISVIAVEDPVHIFYDEVVYLSANSTTRVFSNITIARAPFELNTLLFCNVSFRYGVASATIRENRYFVMPPSELPTEPSTNASALQHNLQSLFYTSTLKTGDEDVAIITIGHQGVSSTYSYAEVETVIL